MIVAACQHERTKKHGRDKSGQQRFRCVDCGKTWIDLESRPLGTMRLEMDKAVFALKLLLEGTSIRAIERLTGVNRNTVCDLVVLIGERCERFLKSRIQDVPVSEVECDEMWGFIGMKERTRQLHKASEVFGDCYCYVAMECTTKLVLTYHVDKRSSEGTWEFIDNLFHATAGRFQVSTDGYRPYQAAIPLIFRFGVDYAQVIKRFGGSTDTEAGRRHSPAAIVSTEITRGCGTPDLDRACTSHSERLNLSLRMGIRRLTRLTKRTANRGSTTRLCSDCTSLGTISFGSTARSRPRRLWPKV